MFLQETRHALLGSTHLIQGAATLSSKVANSKVEKFGSCCEHDRNTHHFCSNRDLCLNCGTVS